LSPRVKAFSVPRVRIRSANKLIIENLLKIIVVGPS
jgi:hypothetical protein